jgi:hypothetical protein
MHARGRGAHTRRSTSRRCSWFMSPAEGAHPLHLLAPPPSSCPACPFAACCLPRRLRLPAAQVDGPAGATAVKLQEAGDPVALQRSSSSHVAEEPQQQSRRQLWRQRIQCARMRHVALPPLPVFPHPRGRHYQMSHAARRCAHQTPTPSLCPLWQCVYAPSTRPVCSPSWAYLLFSARAHILCCLVAGCGRRRRGCATSLAADSRGAGV